MANRSRNLIIVRYSSYSVIYFFRWFTAVRLRNLCFCLYFMSLEQIQRKIALRYYTHYHTVNSNRPPVCPYRRWSCHLVTSLDEVTDFGQLIPELDHCTLFIVERNVLLSMLHRRPSSEPVFLYFLSLEQIQRKIALRYYTHYLSVNSNRSPVLQ